MDDNSKMKISTITVRYDRIVYTMDYLDKCYRITIDENLYSVVEDGEDALLDGDFCVVEIKGQVLSEELLVLLSIDEKKNELKTSKYKMAQNKTRNTIATMRS